MSDAQNLIPPGSEHDEKRRQLKCRLAKGLRIDREQRQVVKAEEMENTAAMVNSR